MATYSDAELEALMSDLESDLIERTGSAADGGKIRSNICAFANDLPGHGKPGVVLVGVRDDGSCASLVIDDDLLVRLSNIRGEGDVLPLPSMTVQRRRLKGCDVAVVTVEPSADRPVRYRGRVWVRVGPSVREGSAEDERVLGERRRGADLPFDMRPVAGAVLGDLDQYFLRGHYLPAAISRPRSTARCRREVPAGSSDAHRPHADRVELDGSAVFPYIHGASSADSVVRLINQVERVGAVETPGCRADPGVAPLMHRAAVPRRRYDSC